MMCYFAHSLKVFVDLEVSFFLKAFFAWSVFKMRTWGVRQYFVSSHSRLLGRGGGTWQQEQPSLNCTTLCQPRLWIKTQELELEITDLGQGKLSSNTWENDRFGSESDWRDRKVQPGGAELEALLPLELTELNRLCWESWQTSARPRSKWLSWLLWGWLGQQVTTWHYRQSLPSAGSVQAPKLSWSCWWLVWGENMMHTECHFFEKLGGRQHSLFHFWK